MQQYKSPAEDSIVNSELQTFIIFPKVATLVPGLAELALRNWTFTAAENTIIAQQGHYLRTVAKKILCTVRP